MQQVIVLSTEMTFIQRWGR